MSDDAAALLVRTVQLIALDVFNSPLGDDQELEAAIISGLQSTTVRLVADDRNLSCVAGQTAVVSLFALITMMGVAVELDIPDVSLIVPQPPLRGSRLRSALVAYRQDRFPGTPTGTVATPDLIFVLGDTPAPTASAPILRVIGTAWRCQVSRNARPRRWRGSWPIGALAAAGAAAPEAFRLALARISKLAKRPLPPAPRWHFDPEVRIQLDLSAPGLRCRPFDLTNVDFVSGGAITTAAVYCLLRIAGLRGDLRIIEPDRISLDNLNRYILALRADRGHRKIDLLASSQTATLRINGVPFRFDETTLSSMTPLAPRVLVGVDHIPSRWIVQKVADDFVCVAGTSHFFAMVTTHEPGEPCAGCAHWQDDPGTDPIPTISFVSFWAGLMQARTLLIDAAGLSPTSQGLYISPLGLYGPHALQETGVDPRGDCPVGCPASRSLA